MIQIRRAYTVIHFVVIALILFCSAKAAWAVELANIFGDHMVLQADAKVPVWGQGEPGETVTLTIGGQRVSTVVDVTGCWRAQLEPIPSGGPYVMEVSAGDERFTLKDILIGEVWLCSGQSNMEWPLSKSLNGDEEIAAADYPHIRLFLVEKVSLDDKPHDVKGQWVKCDPESAKGFSAVGYFFGRELHTQLDSPVGLIDNAWGGSSAETWMSRQSLLSDPDFSHMVESLPDRQAVLEAYRKALNDWKASGSDGPAPKELRAARQYKWPAKLYDRMLMPLVPYAIRGVIWYQGEDNTSRAYQYRRLFPALIANWRAIWGQDDLPFLYVQLASFHKRAAEPGDSYWAELREVQLMTLSVPHTAMAVTIDIGEADSIHPKNKQDVGRRLALAALAKVYGQDIVYSGPILRSAEIVGPKIRLTMDHTAQGLATSDGQPPRGFEIAEADGPYVWAKAMIDGDTVTVWSDQVTEPATVRYGWADNPDVTLTNSAGLPASPFRTDDRPGLTRDNR